MGSCCSSDAQQTIPNTTSTHAERERNTDSKSRSYEASSSEDSDNEVDTQYSEDSDNEASVSMTIERKQKIIDGFNDAIEKGNDSLVMYYVQEHPAINLLETRFPNGDNALHVAVMKKAYNLIIYLLKSGISPNSQNEITGDSPLHTAARIRDVKCVALLYKNEADIDIHNNEHETALSIASDNGDEDIMELLTTGVYITPNTYNYINKNRESHILSTMNEDRLEYELTALTDDILKDVNKPKKQLQKIKVINENTLSPPDSNISFQNKYNQNFGNGGTDRPNLFLNTEKSLEEKLEPTSLRKLQEIKIARNNPFSKLRRENTQKALEVMERITHEAGKLPKLEAWLEKKKQSPSIGWQKRWVIVKESHFLWSDKQRGIKNAKSAKERAKFNGNFNLMCITEITAIEKSKSQRKFKIIAKEGSKSRTKQFLFKAASKQDRDYWVKSLNIHINHMRELLVYLGTK